MRTGRSPAPRRTGTNGGRLGLYPSLALHAPLRIWARHSTSRPCLHPRREVSNIGQVRPWLCPRLRPRPRLRIGDVRVGLWQVGLEVRPPRVVLADSTARALIRTLALEGADYIHFILPTCGIHMAQVPLPHHHTCSTSGIQWGSNAPRCLRNGA